MTPMLIARFYRKPRNREEGNVVEGIFIEQKGGGLAITSSRGQRKGAWRTHPKMSASQKSKESRKPQGAGDVGPRPKLQTFMH